MKTTSRIAVAAAAASLMASGAMAADLGGNCCADLEERVAELEATAARKGNRKVSLTVYGQVNEAVMFWDDGHESNAYVVSFNQSRTRFGFRGSAQIDADWSAGYLLEIGVRYANSGNRNQGTDRAGGDSNTLDIRHSAWYLDSKRLGRLWVGQTSSATDGITEIDLSNRGVVAGPDPSSWVGGFFLRDGSSLTNRTWNQITPSFVGSWAAGEGDRNNIVRYVSPTLHGFSFSAAWGEDDMWDVALRYAGEFNGVRIAAGIGYKQQNDNPGKSGADGQICADLTSSTANSAVDCNALALSASIMHVPTGLFLSGSWGRIEDNNRRELFYDLYGIYVEDTDEHWHVSGGLERKFFALGKTTIYGEYARYDAGAILSAAAVSGDGTYAGGPQVMFNPWEIGLGSKVDMWGIGVVQTIDAAAMDLYVAYRNFSADVTLYDTEFGETYKRSFNDHSTVMAGGIIRF